MVEEGWLLYGYKVRLRYDDEDGEAGVQDDDVPGGERSLTRSDVRYGTVCQG